MLTTLIDRRAPWSLERLQLIKMNFSSTSENTDGEPGLTRSGDLNQFLTLTTHIDNCSCAITYFLRGMRRYYRITPEPCVGEVRALSPITPVEIEKFFAALDQKNSCLWNDDLAKLVGRAQVLVPTQMLIALLFEQLSLENASNIDMDFHRAIAANTPLDLVINKNSDEINGVLMSEGNVAISVSARVQLVH